MVEAHLCGTWHLGDLRTPAVVSPKGDNVEVPASEATKHWECQENTDGLKLCPKILLMEEIRLTTKDDDYPIVYRV